MAKEGVFNGFIEVNGVDLSDHCQTFSGELGHNDIPFHAMGDTSEFFTPGLKTGAIAATFIQDFVAASVHRTLSPIYENQTLVPVRWRAKTGEVASASNPEYSGTFYVGSYRAIGGDHGEGTLATVSFVRAGNVINTV